MQKNPSFVTVPWNCPHWLSFHAVVFSGDKPGRGNDAAGESSGEAESGCGVPGTARDRQHRARGARRTLPSGGSVPRAFGVRDGHPGQWCTIGTHGTGLDRRPQRRSIARTGGRLTPQRRRDRRRRTRPPPPDLATCCGRRKRLRTQPAALSMPAIRGLSIFCREIFSRAEFVPGRGDHGIGVVAAATPSGRSDRAGWIDLHSHHL